MSAFETVMDALRARGERVIARAGTARTRGLCHDGDSPDTVAIGIGHDKRVLVHCFKGCGADDYTHALGLAMADLYDTPKPPSGLGTVVTSYTYTDADGTVVQYVDRYQPKQFRPRLPDGTHKHPPKNERVLYRLPGVIAQAKAGGTVYVVEGEKDADRLTQAGAVATTMPGGTGMGWMEHYSEALLGADVAVIADRDPDGQGLTHARKVTASLQRHGIPHRILLAAVGKDVADHLAAGLGPGDLITPEQLDQAQADPPQEPEQDERLPEDEDVVDQKVNALIGELLDTDDLDNIPNLQPLIADMLFLDSLARVNGPSGHGKSFVTLDFAGCVGTGSDWHGHTTTQGLVIYLVAEGARGIRKRVRAWEQQYGMRMTGVKFLPRPIQAMDVEWLVLIEACRRLRPALIIGDTQARITVGVEENSATEMGRVVHRMEELRAQSGACVLLVHHKGLSGDHGRGSTAVKGAMQTELTVTKEGSRVMVATDKQKDTEELGKIGFTLTSVQLDGEADEEGRPITSAVLVPIDTPMPVSPGQIASWLESSGVPADWGRDRVTKVLVEAGIKARKEKIEEAVRIRKTKGMGADIYSDIPDNAGELAASRRRSRSSATHKDTQNGTDHLPQGGGSLQKVSCPTSGAGFQETPDQTCPQPPGQDLPPSSLNHLPPPSSFRRGQVGAAGAANRAENEPVCDVCGHRLDADWAARGHHTHLAC